MSKVPLFIRSFIIDFVETGLAAIFAASIVFPGSLDDVKAAGVVFGMALLGALISAARRAVPGLLLWLRGILEVPSA